MLTWRAERQVVMLAVIISFILGAIAFVAYRVYPATTCFDNQKNQNETGVDCGGACIPCELKNPKPVNLIWTKVVPVRADSYDAVVEIQNPNEVLGAAEVNYEFTLFDADGTAVRKTGKTFLFPQERMHIIETDFRTSRKPNRVEFRILRVDWQLAHSEDIPNVVVERRAYRVLEDGGRKRSVVEASILNRMPFAYKTVEVNFVIYDKQGNALGANKVRLEDLQANSRKIVTAIWPEEIGGAVDGVIVEPRINTFEADNGRPAK